MRVEGEADHAALEARDPVFGRVAAIRRDAVAHFARLAANAPAGGGA